jgi:hypothetical protein
LLNLRLNPRPAIKVSHAVEEYANARSRVPW